MKAYTKSDSWLRSQLIVADSKIKGSEDIGLNRGIEIYKRELKKELINNKLRKR